MQGLIDLSGHQVPKNVPTPRSTQAGKGEQSSNSSGGQVGSVSVQMGAASMLDKAWHPCWIWRKAQLYIMEGQHGKWPVSAQLAKAKQP